MKKSDLIAVLAEKHILTGKQAEDIVDLVFDGFCETLKNGGRIEIRDFGAFTVRKHEAYKGRNPKTGEYIDVKPKRSPFFKVGKELKKMVNGKK
ncbi:MAG: HU family DNA-binding protein [Smithella sp.]|jgi:integration host factor subunit beta